jgi:hypothetical protein
MSYILSSRAIVSHGNAKKDGLGRLVAGLPHDAIVRQQGSQLKYKHENKNYNSHIIHSLHFV